jgi:hypothetical protein
MTSIAAGVRAEGSTASLPVLRLLRATALLAAAFFVLVQLAFLVVDPVVGAMFDTDRPDALVGPAARLLGLPGVEQIVFAIAAVTIVVVVVFGTIAQTAVGYFALSLGALVLIAVAWWLGSSGRSARATMAVGTIAIVTLPLTLAHHPPVVPTAGHAMRWPTDPGPIAGVSRRMQDMFDSQPCTYAIVEWGPDGTLYYQSRCGGRNRLEGERRMWAYHPDHDRRPRPVSATPGGIESVPLDGQPSARVRTISGLRRTDASHPDAPAIHASRSVPSPDGRWEAVVVADSYDPADLVVVSR